MRLDLTGQRFGRLVAIEPTDERRRGLVVWRCRCDCGREVEVVGSSLVKGNTRSCGCLREDSKRIDITGERFGRLVALEPTDKRVNGSVVWRCRCDCGNEVEVTTGQLTSGNTRSCGCLRGGPDGHSISHDLTGRRFGRLVALRPAGRKNGYVVWECQCDCGNIKLATSQLLVGGKTRSCGCLRRKDVKLAEDSSSDSHSPIRAGRRFGALVAVDCDDPSLGDDAIWRCLCDCNNSIHVRAADLLSGDVRDCGCGAGGDSQ